MVLPEDAEPLQLGVGLGEREHGGIPRRDRFHLGIGEFLSTDVFGTADDIIACHDLADEPRLGLQGLPHVGVERSFGDVAKDRHLLVLIALAQDSAFALFDLSRLPGSVEVMQRHEAFLYVGTGAHLLRAADEHPDLATTDLLEEGLFLGVRIGVTNDSDLVAGDTVGNQLL